MIFKIFERLVKIDSDESRMLLSTNTLILLAEVRKIVIAKGHEIVDTFSNTVRRLTDLECDEEILLLPTSKLLAELITRDDPIVRAVVAEEVCALLIREKLLYHPHKSASKVFKTFSKCIYRSKYWHADTITALGH